MKKYKIDKWWRDYAFFNARVRNPDFGRYSKNYSNENYRHGEPLDTTKIMLQVAEEIKKLYPNRGLIVKNTIYEQKPEEK